MIEKCSGSLTHRFRPILAKGGFNQSRYPASTLSIARYGKGTLRLAALAQGRLSVGPIMQKMMPALAAEGQRRSREQATSGAKAPLMLHAFGTAESRALPGRAHGEWRVALFSNPTHSLYSA
jgi:hypothetical protein